MDPSVIWAINGQLVVGRLRELQWIFLSVSFPLLFSFRLLFFLLFQNEISNKMSSRSTFPQQHSDNISSLQAVEPLAINIIALRFAFFFQFS